MVKVGGVPQLNSGAIKLTDFCPINGIFAKMSKNCRHCHISWCKMLEEKKFELLRNCGAWSVVVQTIHSLGP